MKSIIFSLFFLVSLGASHAAPKLKVSYGSWVSTSPIELMHATGFTFDNAEYYIDNYVYDSTPVNANGEFRLAHIKEYSESTHCQFWLSLKRPTQSHYHSDCVLTLKRDIESKRYVFDDEVSEEDSEMRRWLASPESRLRFSKGFYNKHIAEKIKFTFSISYDDSRRAMELVNKLSAVKDQKWSTLKVTREKEGVYRYERSKNSAILILEKSQKKVDCAYERLVFESKWSDEVKISLKDIRCLVELP